MRIAELAGRRQLPVGRQGVVHPQSVSTNWFARRLQDEIEIQARPV